MSEEPRQVTPASVHEIRKWLDRNEIMLVDVRETSEYDKEHIAGALLMPLSSLEPDIFPKVPGKRLVLHCAVGKRSEAAGKMLLKEGQETVIHMTGGIEAWKAAGFATETQIIPPDEDKPQEPLFLCPLPGDVLQDEYMKPAGISAADLAQAIGVLEGTVRDLLEGNIEVNVELSLRLARYFSTAADFWVHLQMEYDLERARHKIGEQIRGQITPRANSV